MSRDLHKNLRLLCSYHRSIAEVCRQLDVNRSQFNRYLSGETYPSLRIMQRICDFFGVEESEILLPHGQFTEMVRLKPNESGARAEKNIVSAIAEDVRLSSMSGLDRYIGYYNTYYFSMSHPGKILRSLSHIYRTPFGINIKSIEAVGHLGSHKFTCKYEGACYLLDDRIFMTVMEMLTRNEVMQIILYPSYNNRINYLTGIVSGVAARAQRPPAATQIIFQYLGEKVKLREQMKLCALYEPDDPAIPEDIRRSLMPALRANAAPMEAPLA